LKQSIQKQSNIFTDVWKFYKEHINTEKDWNEIIKESHGISKKYDNDKLCNELLVAVIGDLDRK